MAKDRNDNEIDFSTNFLFFLIRKDYRTITNLN